jgi:hypothetical protein
MALIDSQISRVIVDSGRGPNPGKVTLAEACLSGDVLGYAGGWKRALATVSSVIQGRLVALKGGVSGEEIPVSANPVVSGYSGATVGAAIYAAEGTAYGQITETAPSTSNDANTILGYALNATTVQFNIGRPDSLAS